MAIDPNGNAWWNNLFDYANTLIGLLNPISKITAVGAIGVAMIQGKWSELQHDWNSGAFNPFNQNAQVALESKVFSFYKGESVVRHSLPDPATSLQICGTIFLNTDEQYNDSGIETLNHEWGHGVQEHILGSLYLTRVAIPSVAYFWFGSNADFDYYSTPWERTADLFGGVNRFVKDDPIKGYKKGSILWAIIENGLGPITIPFYFKYGY
jgi:hypothetical protein